jgi:probable F420-dependent oxidoreductase
MIHRHPFSFSVILETIASREDFLAAVRRIEALGYDTILVPDHFWLNMDPAVALMAAADATSLRVGSYVFSNDFRNPAVLARQAAELDLLSGGRFQLGLGCGYSHNDYTQAGIPFDPPRVRLERLEEALHILKQFFADEEVTFSGRYFQVTHLQAAPKPVQRPRPPIYIGGGGKRVLTLAAREADIVGITAESGPRGMKWQSTFESATQEKLTWVREAAGRRFDQLQLSSTLMLIAPTEDREQAAQQISQMLAQAREDPRHPAHHIAGDAPLSPEEVLRCQSILIGTVDQMAEELRHRRERDGFSHFEVFASQMEAFAPVVARLRGEDESRDFASSAFTPHTI